MKWIWNVHYILHACIGINWFGPKVKTLKAHRMEIYHICRRGISSRGFHFIECESWNAFRFATIKSPFMWNPRTYRRKMTLFTLRIFHRTFREFRGAQFAFHQFILSKCHYSRKAPWNLRIKITNRYILLCYKISIVIYGS